MEASLTNLDAADPINFSSRPLHQFTETAASIIVAAAATNRAVKDSDTIRNRVFNLLAPDSRVAVGKVLDAIGEKPGSGCTASVEVPASEVDPTKFLLPLKLPRCPVLSVQRVAPTLITVQASVILKQTTICNS